VAHDTQTFALYTIMGLLTTVVFWGFEWGFHWAFETKEMRYLGGVIGLAIGYLIKYHLDKRFVFKSEPL
jgi:putative flippase GtrA